MKLKRLGDGGIDALMRGESLPGLDTRGKLCYGTGFGFATLGNTRLGDDRLQGGIYQRRMAGYNQFTGKPTGKKKFYYVKMRNYAPTNPRTTLQQANRAKMTAACAGWNSLTIEQKSIYNKRATRAGKVGRQLYISEYLKTH